MSIDPNVAYWGDRCCKAEAEIERLRKERDRAWGMGWESRNDEVERLRAALKRYGQHDLICPVSAGADRKHCSCGLAALEQSAHENPQVKTPSAFEHTPGTGSVR